MPPRALLRTAGSRQLSAAAAAAHAAVHHAAHATPAERKRKVHEEERVREIGHELDLDIEHEDVDTHNNNTDLEADIPSIRNVKRARARSQSKHAESTSPAIQQIDMGMPSSVSVPQTVGFDKHLSR